MPLFVDQRPKAISVLPGIGLPWPANFSTSTPFSITRRRPASTTPANSAPSLWLVAMTRRYARAEARVMLWNQSRFSV